MPSSTMPAGTGTNKADVGMDAWVDPGNITSSNDVLAVASLSIGNASHFLHATNFGFSIPAGATIDGIVVEIERSNNGFDMITDKEVLIIKGGTRGSTNKADLVTTWPFMETVASYGTGTTDLWGETWTYTDINSSNFGVALQALHTGFFSSDEARVDFIEITVYYTEAGTSRSFPVGGKLTGGMLLKGPAR